MSLLCFSCEDFLEEKQVSNISYEFYNSEQGIESLIWAAYAPLRTFAGQEEGLRLSQMGTDIHASTGVAVGNEFQLYSGQLASTNANIGILWTNFYKGINSCNIAINRVPRITGTQALRTPEGKNRRTGEVRFLRAYYYFMLVQTYGRIPLLLDENTQVLDDLKRAPVADVYNAIIADLTFAAANLPLTQNDYARPVRAAAEHLLAKVYLTRGSAVTDQRGQKPTDMDSAAVYAERVIKAKGALLPNFDDARRPTNEKNNEVLFAVQFTTNVLANGSSLNNGGGNQAHMFYVAQYDNISGGGVTRDVANGRPFVRLRPTDYLYDLFDRKIDSRFYKAYKTTFFCNTTNASLIAKWTAASAPRPDLVGKPKFAVGDTAIFFSMDKSVPDARIAARKYVWFPRNKFTERFFPHYQYHLDPTRLGVNEAQGFYDFKLFWLSESYLIAAESHGRKGDYQKAADYINVVRRRAAYKEGEPKTTNFYLTDGGSVANLTRGTEKDMEISVSTINSADKLRDFILDERAREFGGDYERWYDLARTETFYDRIRKYNPAAATNVKPFHKLRPIPQSHIDRLANAGPQTEEQNEGY